MIRKDYIVFYTHEIIILISNDQFLSIRFEKVIDLREKDVRFVQFIHPRRSRLEKELPRRVSR